jgi:hypothetical protein
MFEAPAIIGTCINCIAPGSLAATFALIVIGAGIALTAERRKLVGAISAPKGAPEISLRRSNRD